MQFQVTPCNSIKNVCFELHGNGNKKMKTGEWKKNTCVLFIKAVANTHVIIKIQTQASVYNIRCDRLIMINNTGIPHSRAQPPPSTGHIGPLKQLSLFFLFIYSYITNLYSFVHLCTLMFVGIRFVDVCLINCCFSYLFRFYHVLVYHAVLWFCSC